MRRPYTLRGTVPCYTLQASSTSSASAIVESDRDNTTNWDIQVRKGVLELVVLLALRDSERYGYELITIVTRAMDFEITEGTIYPLLSRLLKTGLLSAHWVENKGSVPRKYYRLTRPGRHAVDAMQQSWTKLTRAIQQLASRGVPASEGPRSQAKAR